jgi:hypothetical protein
MQKDVIINGDDWKGLLTFIAGFLVRKREFHLILTSNPQIIRGNMENWKITRFGNASKGRENSRINKEIRSSLSRKTHNCIFTIFTESFPGLTTVQTGEDLTGL